jgi:hypothetical protein
MHDHGHNHRVAPELHIHHPAVALGVLQHQAVDRGQRVRDADEKEEWINRQRRERARVLELDEDRRAEQQRHDRHAARDQPEKLDSDVGLHLS